MQTPAILHLASIATPKTAIPEQNTAGILQSDPAVQKVFLGLGAA